MKEKHNVLVLNSRDAEMEALISILEHHAAVESVLTISHMQEVLRNDTGLDVFVCPFYFHRVVWIEVVAGVRPFQPGLPVIVVSKASGWEERKETVDAGAVDLLVPPFHSVSVVGALKKAQTAEKKISAASGKSPRSP